MSIGEDRKDLCSRHCERQDGSSANEGAIHEPKAREMARIFKLSDRAGAKIVRGLPRREVRVCDTGVIVEMGQSAAFHQLRSLPGVRPVDPRRGGRSAGYSLAGEYAGSLLSQDIKHIGYEPE